MRMAEPSMDAFTVAMSLSATLMATALFTRVSSVVFASSAIGIGNRRFGYVEFHPNGLWLDTAQ